MITDQMDHTALWESEQPGFWDPVLEVNLLALINIVPRPNGENQALPGLNEVRCDYIAAKRSILVPSLGERPQPIWKVSRKTQR